MAQYYLGIDTSNYTTSMAVVDAAGLLIYEKRKLLEVKKGERGLRQSDALFQHVLTMPELFEDFTLHVDSGQIKKVIVSSRPRPVENSYMPVFRAGQSYGKVLASTLNCGYQEFSHQENHIKAAEWSAGANLGDQFIAIHISGGTTEILKIIKKQNAGYDIVQIGGTKDISIGQLIDRIGVSLGLDFPAGKALDRMAVNSESFDFKLPASVKGTFMNLSGPETKAMRAIAQGGDSHGIAWATFQCISKSLEAAILNACQDTALHQVIIVGGVASSSYIRDFLSHSHKLEGIDIHYGDAKYCTDHAVGTALLGID
ncbi:N6-L-threonylcarbamoyladenine synthase [Anaerosolibacter carboniphilus]|uniref:N(6)-L-threonylcarbamoyladenine synthase n=1 Tax=Anaerosolibacter carboniphilus TaxID=1417629 RepID=A0A841L2L1_9FIRM|nr:O-sialoglycoprotein endopeptidase [Anaerosolibacter carboniphilus]MBB6216629.1 N6-L-threonylcarbamoyladenine synthase [Anaerosolibacter carboniphilus]